MDPNTRFHGEGPNKHTSYAITPHPQGTLVLAYIRLVTYILAHLSKCTIKPFTFMVNGVQAQMTLLELKMTWIQRI